MAEAFIIDSLRTPIGRLGGALASIRADDLAALTIRELLKRHPEVDPEAIEDVCFGCANQAGEDNRNVARMAALLAGLPPSVPAETVNRLCASGMSAVLQVARAVRLGEGDLYIAGGVEQMTRAPLVLSKSERAYSGRVQIFDSTLGWRFINPAMEKLYGAEAMGCTAEHLVEEMGIERSEQDLFALRSHRRAVTAQASGRLAREIVPVEVPSGRSAAVLFSQDESVRRNTSLEALQKLRPVFRTDGRGSVTAGNSSGLSDGSCALLIASERGMRRFGLQPRVRVAASAVVGVPPRVMGIGPVGATRKLLDREGIPLYKIDLLELNEAFAAQSLACLRELEIEADDPRLNPNGGAIALGHPLGMSGARLLATAALELQLRRQRFALCTMCVGVGQGMAVLLEGTS